MKKQILILGLALWALAGGPAELVAQTVASGFEPNPRRGVTQVGTRGANFLRIGPDARSRAMGDAGTALIENAAGALHYNPAAPALAEGFDVVGSWMDLYGGSGVTLTHMGMVLPVGQHAFGLQTTVFNSGIIQPTTEWTPYGFDPLLGDFMEWKAVSVGATYARRITDRLSMGLTAKYLQEGIDFATVDWYALDIGTVFETGIYGVRMAMAVTNISGESRFEGPAIYGSVDRIHRIFDDKILGTTLYFRHDTQGMLLPTAFRMALQTQLMGAPYSVMGGAGGPHALNAAAEVNDAFDTDFEGRIGLEYSFRDVLYVRGGKYFQNEDRAPWTLTDGLSAGGGVRLPFLGRQIGLDYAYTAMGVLDNIQSFSFRFGAPF